MTTTPAAFAAPLSAYKQEALDALFSLLLFSLPSTSTTTPLLLFSLPSTSTTTTIVVLLLLQLLLLLTIVVLLLIPLLSYY